MVHQLRHDGERQEEGYERPEMRFRKDSEGDVHAFCVVRVNGEEKEVTLPIIHGKRYEIGQWVTLYLNPETGDVLALPRMDTNG